MRHIELLKAKKYYGKHATGYVFIVNGFPCCHMSLKDIKETNLYQEYLNQKDEK